LIILGIDQEKCIDCYKCVKVCPSKLYSLSNREEEKKTKVLFSNPHTLCVRCGHCLAICPTNAILFKDADQCFEIEGTMNIEEIVSYEDLLKALRMRRSLRVFKDEDVPKEKIEAILEAMRYAPSASNSQSWRYIILTNKNEIKFLSEETSKIFKTARKILPLKYLIAPFLPKKLRRRAFDKRTKIQLDNSLERIKQGEDVIFFNAPCVIILYSRKYTSGLSANDAGIAFTHGMLAAQSLGLGTCWIGFSQRRLQNKTNLRKHFGIPKGFQVWGVLILGVPAIKYQRAPPRRPLRVNWFE